MESPALAPTSGADAARLLRLRRLLSGRRWLSPLASGLLVCHLLGMALAGFSQGVWPGLAYMATALGLVAVPVCSWEIARRIDGLVCRRDRRAVVQAAMLMGFALTLIAITPAVFRGLRGVPLPAVGRVLELVSVFLSISVVSGLVLLGLGLADLVYEATTRFKHLATRLMFLVTVTVVGTFLWLGFLGWQAHWLVLWAVEQGHLEPYVRGLAYLEQLAGTYIGSLAGAIGLELPFVLLLAWRFGHNATASLVELQEGFKRVARGDFDHPVAVIGNDEVAEMQRGFNQMLEATAERQFLETAFGRYVSPVVLQRIRETRRAQLIGERREATVMFSDIRDFTAISAQLAPEEVIALMNRYMSLMIDTIARYDGYINKFVGDAILVVFNAPLDQPTHALRALCCAVAMQRALAEANQRRDLGQWQLRMGIGINTGPLVAGTLGNERQMEYTVLGDTVNVASRVSHEAGCEVAVTRRVLEAARAQAGAPAEIAATSLGSVELKGKGEVALFLVDEQLDRLEQLLLAGDVALGTGSGTTGAAAVR